VTAAGALECDPGGCAETASLGGIVVSAHAVRLGPFPLLMLFSIPVVVLIAAMAVLSITHDVLRGFSLG
jgi:hypothetical protein